MTEARADGRQHLICEGWRFIPHSAAISHQFHCLELLRRVALRLSIRDRAFQGPWTQVAGLMPQAMEQSLHEIPVAPPGAAANAVIRIEYPLDLSPSGDAPTFVMAGSAAGSSPAVGVMGGAPLAETLAGNSVGLLTPSEWTRQGLIAAGVPEDRVQVVPRGFDPGFMRPATGDERDGLRDRFGWTDEFVFVHVGALTENKGTDLVLRAFANLLAQGHERIRLVVKGIDSVYRSEGLLEMMKMQLPAEIQPAVAERLTYIGGNYAFVDMARLFQCADALVAPYRWESYCSPVLEAAACGLPVICTAGGPTDEYTADAFALKVAAQLDPAQRRLHPDEASLLQQMTRAIGDPAWCAAAGEAGPAHVAGLTWRAAADRLLEAVGITGV